MGYKSINFGSLNLWKRIIQRCIIIVIAVIAVLFIMPQFFVSAYGQEVNTVAASANAPALRGSGSYDLSKSSWQVLDGGSYTFTGSTQYNHIRVYAPNSSVTITLDNVDIRLQGGKEYPAIDIQEESNVTIILKGNNYLSGGKRDSLLYTDDGYAGIRVHNTSELTIIGDGSLEAVGWQGRRGAAGIGGNYDNSCGKVTIGNGTDNPTVTARGGGPDGGDDGAAGIGGGYDGQANDGIIINSGTVTAKGGNGAAGIGGGQAYGAGSGGKAENITINGGTVTAVGGEDAAGIGGGECGSSGEGGNVTGITITGGNITATGGSSGAGIGGSKDAVARNIVISGGTINAKGGDWAAGIGAGNAVGTGGGGKIDGLTITGGNITATGGSGAAGIGGGDEGDVYDLKIQQASGKELVINAIGGEYGAGIGNGNTGAAGNAGMIQNDIGDITISLCGGTITAKGGYGGAGIGGGNSKADNIEITGSGTITATGGDHSSAIGAGKKEDGGDITIKGTDGGRNLIIYGHATKSTGDNDAAVIGGADSAGGDITISNATLYLDSPYNCRGAAIGSGSNASMIAEGMGDITITNCYVDDKSSHDRDAASIGAGFTSLVDNITIKDSEIKGGTIGGTDNGNEVFRNPSIESITISGSVVTAESTIGQRAAIGSGRFEGIKSITIENSEVTASTASGAGIGSAGYSSGTTGDGLKWTGNACGDITITGSTVSAQGRDGGAGIGGGWGTPVGEVNITDSTVTAASGNRGDNQGGSGIGGGWCESAGDITISGSKVTATGAGHSAGIGCSGSDTASAVLWNTTCNSIHIEEGSDVTATGGNGAAGIGTGYGAQYGSYARIKIDDSTVTAKGGDYGAGIGAGRNGSAGAGGESDDIDIFGKSKVTATGGIGGAGIGGGYDGGADIVTIDLDETSRQGDDWKYYVKAYGGKGAAGIGSGGVYDDPDDKLNTAQHGHDIEKVYIQGGYVYAGGGDDENGAGAGIGGGARGGNLNYLYVGGGFVQAEAGYGYSSYDKADDIGTGGEDNRDAIDNGFTIVGGTVLGGLSDEPELIIDGGSVRHKTGEAKRSDGTKVYRTQMKVEEKYAALDSLKTSVEYYGKDDVISDEDQKVYLYLPELEANKATADFKIGGNKRSYYNNEKVNSSGDIWLKMDYEIPIKLLDEPLVGENFRIKAGTDGETGQARFAVGDDSSAMLLNGDTAVSSLETDISSEVTLRADKFGEFSINVKGIESDHPMYWSAEGNYTGKITKARGTIAFTETPAKVYDGEPVEDSSITTNSNGTVQYTYYKDSVSDANKLQTNEKPTNAGEYVVVASIADTGTYTACQAEQHFTIAKRPVYLTLTAEEKDTNATVTAEINGYLDKLRDDEALGKVNFTVKEGASHTAEVRYDRDKGKYISSYTFDGVSADTYTINAILEDADNYVGIPVEQDFKKNYAERTISIASPDEITYGADAFDITAQLSSDWQETNDDKYVYDIVWDAYEIYEKNPANDKKTVSVSNTNGSAKANVTIQYAGMSLVKVTLKGTELYADATAYVMITVNRAELTVTPYAYIGDDIPENRINNATYGELEQVKYGLDYVGFLSGDGEKNFTKNHGELAAAGLSEQSDAGMYSLGVNRVPETVGTMFLSRNYKINVEDVKFTVDKASTTITPEDATGEYGIEPDYTYTATDLTPWDSQEKAFPTQPKITTYDGNKKKEYIKFTPGTYTSVLGISNQEQVKTDTKNYNVNFGDNADLTINKASLTLNIERGAKVYDGKPFEVKPTLDTGSSLAYDGKVEYQYFRITKDGMKQMMRAPKDAGFYIVKAKAPDTNCYEGDTDIALLRIKKAPSNPKIPQLPDIYYKDGLTLADQKLPKGWRWYHPDRKLDVGSVSAYAVYIPADPDNYRCVVKMLWFNVLEKDQENGGMGKPEEKDDGNGNKDSSAGTGDVTNPTLWGIIMMASVFAAAMAITFGRRKGNNIDGG